MTDPRDQPRRSPPWPERIVWAALAALFFFAAAVQYNDPDPALWVLVYGVGASTMAWRAAARRMHLALPLLISLMSLAWAAYLATIVFGPAEVTPMFGDAIDGNILIESEEGREMLGLAMLGLAEAALAWRLRRR